MNDFRQWIADAYHCSEIWGQEMTEGDMRTLLIESRLQAFPDDYVPDTSLSAACTAYWNELCRHYPN